MRRLELHVLEDVDTRMSVFKIFFVILFVLSLDFFLSLYCIYYVYEAFRRSTDV